jgi:hypothetical protein
MSSLQLHSVNPPALLMMRIGAHDVVLVLSVLMIGLMNVLVL